MENYSTIDGVRGVIWLFDSTVDGDHDGAGFVEMSSLPYLQQKTVFFFGMIAFGRVCGSIKPSSQAE